MFASFHPLPPVCAIVIVVLASLRGAAATESWPCFRGPTGQGLADETPVPLEWSAANNVVWKTPTPGQGHSSPVILGDQVWLSTATPEGSQLGVVCFDRNTGELRHSIAIFRPSRVEEIHLDNSYASPTPVLIEGRLFVDFGTYGAACVETSSGEVLWKNESLQIEHQGGAGSSPVIHGDRLILTRDGADAQYVVALDAGSGRVLWKQSRSAPRRPNPVTHRAFATPLLHRWEDRTLLISPAADQCHAYDADSGEELWHVRYVGFSNVPCPVGAAGQVYLCTGFFSPQIVAVALGGAGNVTDSHVKWSHKSQIPDVSSPILVDGRLYFVSNKGVLTCLDGVSGERLSVTRLGGNFNASPVYAGGHLYFCSREGVTKVIRPGDKPEIVATNRLPGSIMASPAVAGSALYIRTTDALYRIEEPAP